MNKLRFSRSAFTFCVAVAMLAGCGGSQPPIGATGATAQTSTIATRGDRAKSWMLPEAKYVKKLLYISNISGSKSVQVYDYKTQTQVGSLGGFTYPGASA